MKNLTLLLIVCALVSSCKTTKSKSTFPEIDKLSILKEFMIGSFTSEAQSIVDTTYYNISLHMYPIWEDRTDAQYLYVEQALTAMPDKPYRQRIYKVTELSDNNFGSSIYTLDTPENYIGKWKSPEYFDQFDPTILTERDGCTVYLTLQVDGSYSGSTLDKECKSTLRGASYATSIVSIYSDKIVSWDQGFDSLDQQVWGALNGGYIFDKLQ